MRCRLPGTPGGACRARITRIRTRRAGWVACAARPLTAACACPPGSLDLPLQADVAVLVISSRKGEYETGFEKGGQVGGAASRGGGHRCEPQRCCWLHAQRPLLARGAKVLWSRRWPARPWPAHPRNAPWLPRCADARARAACQDPGRGQAGGSGRRPAGGRRRGVLFGACIAGSFVSCFYCR